MTLTLQTTFSRKGLRRSCLLAFAVVALAAAQGAAAHGIPGAEKWKPLKKGSRGHLVVHVQEVLEVQADGVFGPLTAKAVKRFQRQNGLAADGIVGAATATALGLFQPEADTAIVLDGPYLEPTEAEQLTLDRIAGCESGGDPTTVSSGGTYRGKYQFHTETWARLGGQGDPAAASEEEQDYRALLLVRQSGTAPWGRCA